MVGSDFLAASALVTSILVVGAELSDFLLIADFMVLLLG
jgi:hypothetical protein